MSTLLFPTYGIDADNVQLITDIYDRIRPDFSAEFDFDCTFNFNDFELFSYYDIYHFGPVICLNKNLNPFYLTFVQVLYKLNLNGRYSNPTYAEFQTWGVITLKKMYGHILIKSETILDKIHEIINPIELDFKDDEEFNKKFYVVTNDKLKAELLMTKTFRSYIQNLQVKDFVIEIIDNKLMIGNKKIIEIETALAFVRFLNGMSKRF